MSTDSYIALVPSPVLCDKNEVQLTIFGHTMKLPRITRVRRITCFEDTLLRGRIAEVVITTPSKKINLRCDPNTDEVVISKNRKAKRGKAFCLVSGNFRVPWIWELKNQQGYDDGFRIELSSGQKTRVFEFVSIASCLYVYEAVKWTKLEPRANGRKLTGLRLRRALHQLLPFAYPKC